ncbi:MAG: hypothetical protein ACRDG4_18030, partial [Chloroflexota bacterium]
DGLPESVRALLVLGDNAALPEQLAAVNLAARLGFETLALELPLAAIDAVGSDVTKANRIEDREGARIPVYIGRPGTLSRRCPEPPAYLLGTCRPGEGIVAVLAAPGLAVLVGGADADGLEAAALAASTDRVALGTPISSEDPDIRAVRISALPELNVERTPMLADVPIRSLADLFGPTGLALDEDDDLLPDRSRTRLVLPSDLSPRETLAVIQLGARIGLETLGLAFPVAVDARAFQTTDHEIPLVVEPASVDTAGSLRLLTKAGRQEIRLGGDKQGRAAALEGLAGLDVWTRAEHPTLADLERGIDRLLALADPGSALCAVLPALDTLSAAVASFPPAPLALTLDLPSSVPLAVEATTACLRDWTTRAVPDRTSTVTIRPVSVDPWLDETHGLAWEFEDAGRLVHSEILPRLTSLPTGSSDWHIDLRMSEPESRRQTLYMAIAAELRAAGLAVATSQIRILPTYHQGRAWL